MRKYGLLSVDADGKKYTLRDLRFVFNLKKSIYGGLNDFQLQIFNLQRNLVFLLSKDTTDTTKIDVDFYLIDGRKQTHIFKGSVFKGSTTKSSEDVVTTINCLDGLDALNQSAISNAGSKYTAYLKLCKEAGLKTGIASFNNSSQRIALQGQILDQLAKLDKNKLFFIENGVAHFLEKKKGVTANFAAFITEDQIVGIPNRSNRFVQIETLANKYINLGGLILLKSLYSGAFRVNSIEAVGDTYGGFFKQKLTCEYLS